MDNTRKYRNEDLDTVVEHEASDKSKPKAEAKNGSMAPDLKEMKRLGKEMEQMKTNQILQREGLTPDPVQDEEDL